MRFEVDCHGDKRGGFLTDIELVAGDAIKLHIKGPKLITGEAGGGMKGLTLDTLRETMRKIGAGPASKPMEPYLYAPRGSWLYKELQKRFGAEHVIHTDPIPSDVVTNLSQNSESPEKAQ